MKIAVFGCGSWGLALGLVLFENGYEVVFWTNSEDEAELLNSQREYPEKLPAKKIPLGVKFTTSMEKAIQGASMLLLVVPSQYMRSVAKQINRFEPNLIPVVVSASKGITEDTLQRMTQVLMTEISWLTLEKAVVLSGPSHAEEVVQGVPTTIVSSGVDSKSVDLVRNAFTTKSLRVYTADDPIGVELAGSLKNVIAIATGVLDGLGLGDNAKGALMTRGLAEITRLGEALGANPRTFAGLTGMGDLITTCMSKHSRNRYVGEQVAQGKKLDDVLETMNMVAEGVPTCKSAVALAKVAKVEMPITNEVYNVLFKNKPAFSAIEDLMDRDPKAEVWN